MIQGVLLVMFRKKRIAHCSYLQAPHIVLTLSTCLLFAGPMHLGVLDYFF